MPKRNISLTTELDEFIDRAVEAGEYRNASEVVRDAVRVLQQRRQEDALKLEVLRMQVRAGVDALEQAAFVEVADEELEDYLEHLVVAAEPQAR